MNIFDLSGPCTLPLNIKNKKHILRLQLLFLLQKGEREAESFGGAFLYSYVFDLAFSANKILLRHSLT